MSKETVFVIAGLATAFGGGFFFGAIMHHKVVMKRIEQLQPLLGNSISDFIVKATSEEMSKDEMTAYLVDELKFIKIAMS